MNPVDDPVFLGRSVGWQPHGVASVQWALNAMETLELAGEYLPQWEAGEKAVGNDSVVGRDAPCRAGYRAAVLLVMGIGPIPKQQASRPTKVRPDR